MCAQAYEVKWSTGGKTFRNFFKLRFVLKYKRKPNKK